MQCIYMSYSTTAAPETAIIIRLWMSVCKKMSRKQIHFTFLWNFYIKMVNALDFGHLYRVIMRLD